MFEGKMYKTENGRMLTGEQWNEFEKISRNDPEQAIIFRNRCIDENYTDEYKEYRKEGTEFGDNGFD